MEKLQAVNGKRGNGSERKSCWARKTKREKRLIVLSVGAGLLLVVLLIVLITYFTRFSSTCLSSACVKTANEFLKLIKADVNPCDDFYEFACGNFGQEEPVEKTLHTNVHNRIRSIIEEPAREHDSGPLTLAKNLYTACLNQDAIDLRGLVLIQDALKQIGGWPALEGNTWDEWHFEWKLATYKLRELGYNYEFLIAVDVIPDAYDPTKTVIRFSPPDTPLNGATDADEELFFDYMVNISVAFGANKALAKSDFRDVIDFQKSLFLNLPEEKKQTYDPLTISELRHKFSDIPWMEYINRLIYPIQSISHDQTVTVTNGAYFKRLQNALRRITKRVIANYIAWRTVRQQTVFLTSELSDLSWRYYSSMVKQSPPTAASKCSDLTEYIFPLPLQAEYVKRFIPKNTKNRVLYIFSKIKEALVYAVANANWIDSETRTMVLERITLNVPHIAFPNTLLEPRMLQEYYKGVEVDATNFFQSMLQANFFKANRMFQRLHELSGYNDDLKDGYATFSRITYSPEDNSITVPAGILQGTMYDDDRPQSLNYGALGSSMGHQMFHMIVQGGGSDKRSGDEWLSMATMMNLDKHMSCVEKHFGEYRAGDPGSQLNISNTKFEDLADIVGVKLAYEAYKRWVSENGVEQKLPSVEYTQQQLFWISSAHRFCGKEIFTSSTNSAMKSKKSRARYRVLSPLRNIDAFSKDFGCPSNSYMNNNNKEKCKIF